MNGTEPETLHTAVLVTPAAERRRLRKQRRRAAARLQPEQRTAERATARAKAEAERAERQAITYLPGPGERGPAQLRSPGRFRLPRHQDTSATLAGAYPFLAEGGLGSDGVFVGQDLYSGGSFVYDPWVLYARGLSPPPTSSWQASSAPASPPWPKACTLALCRSGGACTCPGTRKANTPPSPTLWAGGPSSSATACPPG